MEVPQEKTMAATRHAKRHLENSLAEAQKAEKIATEAKRQRNMQRTKDEKSERLRSKAERRSVAGVEGLSAEASRLSSRRNSHPLTVEQKSEKARVEVVRWSAI